MASLTRKKIAPKKESTVRSGLFINANWTPDESTKVTLKEAFDEEAPGLFEDIDGNIGEVQGTEFANGDLIYNIVIPLKDDSTVECRLSGKSELEEGDLVDLSTVYRINLKKRGENPVQRFDGKKYIAPAE